MKRSKNKIQCACVCGCQYGRHANLGSFRFWKYSIVKLTATSSTHHRHFESAIKMPDNNETDRSSKSTPLCHRCTLQGLTNVSSATYHENNFTDSEAVRYTAEDTEWRRSSMQQLPGLSGRGPSKAPVLRKRWQRTVRACIKQAEA